MKIGQNTYRFTLLEEPIGAEPEAAAPAATEEPAEPTPPEETESASE